MIPRLTLLSAALLLMAEVSNLQSAEISPRSDHSSTNNVYLIDLPTTLQLAGAQNLDIQIARQRLAEARANYQAALWQFFPWIGAGVTYRRHDNLIQNVEGKILDVDKDSYSVGPSLIGQLDLGEAIYRKLAAHQTLKASDYALESQRQDAILAAAQAYLDLLKAAGSITAAREALSLSTNYSGQLEQAVDAGIAFKGDLLRVRGQTERNLLTLRQAQEQETLAVARLAQLLHLDPLLTLMVRETDLVPVTIVDTNATMETLVLQARASRPELKQSRALVQAAQQANKGAVYGPLIPSLGAQIFAGGLGGGKDGDPDRFGASQDYQFTVGWRIGPGGLFDKPRIQTTEARLQIARLGETKLQDEIARQVSEGFTRTQSLRDQMAAAQRAVGQAQETVRLTEQRKEFAVGAVLETIQGQQDLTRARLDLITIIAEHNKAQYALAKAIGELSAPERHTSH